MIDEKSVENNRETTTRANGATTLVSKIARLPHRIREQLNRRIRNGEPASEILPWINAQPVVKKILAAHFGGTPISEKNLSSWRHGGYERWLEKQELMAEVRGTAEDAEEWSQATGAGVAQGAARMAVVRLFKLLQTIPPERCSSADLVKISYAISALLKVEQNNEWLDHDKTRVFQGNEQLVLSWDKHLRGCVDAVQRALNDEIAKDIQAADIDNGEKIELLGHHLFGDKWQGREVGEQEID